MSDPSVRASAPLDAAVRRVQRRLADIRQAEAQIQAVLEVGNLAAARQAADRLSHQAAELSASLGDWSPALSVGRIGGCPDCGGPLDEYNSRSAVRPSGCARRAATTSPPPRPDSMSA